SYIYRPSLVPDRRWYIVAAHRFACASKAATRRGNMKVRWRFVWRSRGATVVAAVVLLSLMAGAAVFHGTLYAWNRGDENADFLTAHVAQMRLEMMRIHRGRVGASDLARISRDISVAAEDATADARDAEPLRSSIARYLADRSNGAESVAVSFVTDAGAQANADAPAAVPPPASATLAADD